MAQANSIARTYECEAAKVEKQIETLLDRIFEAGSPSVVTAHEKRIATLEHTKLSLLEMRETAGRTHGTFEELFELALRFLSSPSKIWAMGKIEYQNLVLRLTFADRLAYCPQSGFRTSKTTMPFNMLDQIQGPKNKMADREGFEPSIRLHVYTRSRRAPSTTRPPAQRAPGSARGSFIPGAMPMGIAGAPSTDWPPHQRTPGSTRGIPLEQTETCPNWAAL